MATFSVPGQNLSYSIPNDGEVFINPNDAWGSTIFIRKGNSIQQVNFQTLGQAEFDKKVASILQKYGLAQDHTFTYAEKTGAVGQELQALGAGNIFSNWNNSNQTGKLGLGGADLIQFGRQAFQQQSGIDPNSIKTGYNMADVGQAIGIMGGSFAQATDYSIFKSTPINTNEVVTLTPSAINPNAPDIKSSITGDISINQNTAAQNQAAAIAADPNEKPIAPIIPPADLTTVKAPTIPVSAPINAIPVGGVPVGQNVQTFKTPSGLDVNAPTTLPPGSAGQVNKPASPLAPTPVPTSGVANAPGSPAWQAEIDRFNVEANTGQKSNLAVVSGALGANVTESDSSKMVKALVASYTAESGKPAQKSQAQIFADKRAELGVGALETEMAGADQSIAKLDADFMSTLTEEEQRQVSSIQIGRRQSKVQTQYQRQRRDLEVGRQGVANRLNQKYAVIDNIMKYSGQDYDNAQQDYQTKFNQAISLTNLIKGIEDSTKTDVDRKVDNARANAQIMISALKDKKVDWNTLDSTTQMDIRNMEMQAGLPVGFMKFVGTAVDEPVVSIGGDYTDASGQRVVPVYTKNPTTGVVTAKIISLGTAAPTAAEKYTSGGLSIPKTDLGVISSALEKARGADGWTDPNLYKKMYDTWVGGGGIGKDFLSQFPPKSFINPANITLPPNLLPSESEVVIPR